MTTNLTELKQIRSIQRKAKKAKTAKRAESPSHDDPRTELKRLVREHKVLTKRSVAVHHMASERTILTGEDKGKKIPHGLPEDVAASFIALSEQAKESAAALVPAIMAQLKTQPIFNEFLKHVFGAASGVIPGYLVAEIDIATCVKPSALRRYCGYAVVDGKLERPTKGEHLHYSTEMRTRLWQLLQGMRKNAAKSSKGFEFGKTNKYLDIWYNAKERATLQGMRPGQADSKGRNKATDIFLLDLYTVWRAIEELPVWPSYYEAKVGYAHLGKPLSEEDCGPKLWTVKEALDAVGSLENRPLSAPRKWTFPVEAVELAEAS